MLLVVVAKCSGAVLTKLDALVPIMPPDAAVATVACECINRFLSLCATSKSWAYVLRIAAVSEHCGRRVCNQRLSEMSAVDVNIITTCP